MMTMDVYIIFVIKFLVPCIMKRYLYLISIRQSKYVIEYTHVQTLYMFRHYTGNVNIFIQCNERKTRQAYGDLSQLQPFVPLLILEEYFDFYLLKQSLLCVFCLLPFPVSFWVQTSLPLHWRSIEVLQFDHHRLKVQYEPHMQNIVSTG